MVMNKELQIHTIAQRLSIMGVEPDTVDLDSLVDSTLSLPENLQRISRKVPVSISEQTVKRKVRLSSQRYKEKAQNIYESWSKQRQRLDERFLAQETFDGDDLYKSEYKKWKKNPERYDIEGVDANRSYSKPLKSFQGRSLSKQDVLKQVDRKGSTHVEDLLDLLQVDGEEEEDVLFYLEELQSEGKVYEPKTNHWTRI